ncbi:MAG: ABC transporter ATP-binding protein [Pseudonocardiales bacterium]
MTDAVVTRGLTKRFRGGQVAVADLDLDVPQGSVFGFLGPNGSGKTTTIRMLVGLAAPTSGTVQLLGEAMPRGSAAALPRVGALIEGPACYPFLSGEANLIRLDMADRTADPRTRTARVDTALQRVGLLAARRKRYKAYSLGMRQRLGLASALLRQRDLLVLDEPTNGLDPQGTREIRALIRSVAEEGATVFLSSHLLAEVEQVCTHAAVLSHGRLVANGTVDSLRTAAAGHLVVSTQDAGVAVGTLRRLGVKEVTCEGGQVSGLADSVPPEVACAALVADGVRVQSLGVQRPSLEEAFVALTGEGFDVAE